MPLTLIAGASLPASAPGGREWRVFDNANPTNAAQAVCIDLANSAYVTGGWPLEPRISGLRHVSNVFQFSGRDPYGKAITNTGLQLALVYTDASRPLLQLRDTGGEVGNGTTRAGAIWVLFTGQR